MYQNEIYTCISWYRKISWFPMKNYWCQQNSKGVSRDSYIFWVFFRLGIAVTSFIIVGYVWQILWREALLVAPIREQSQKSPSWIGLTVNPTKSSNTLKQFVGNFPTNCLSVSDHFVKLAYKRLRKSLKYK